MYCNTDIPEIAITQDASNDFDNDNDYMNLHEAFTDVEDIYDDEVISNHKPKIIKPHKLRIRLNDHDCPTDLEDFEASDNEESDIVMHKNPLSLDDLDLEVGLIEESYKLQTTSDNEGDKLKSQFSFSQHRNSDAPKYQILENSTDEENVQSDNEFDKYEIPDISIDLDLFNFDNMNVMEQINPPTVITPSLTPRIGTPIPTDDNVSDWMNRRSNLLTTQSININTSELTDIEILNSDSEDVKTSTRTKSKRRKHKCYRRHSVTDAEEIEMSDDDTNFVWRCNKPKKKSSKRNEVAAIKNNFYDSDNDDNNSLPFPICKKIAEKKQNILNIPEFDTNFPTDTEEVEDELEDVSQSLVESGNAALEEKLLEIASSYSQTKESHSVRITNKMYTSELDIEKIFGQNDTDVDNYETDENIDQDESSEIKYIHDYNIYFPKNDQATSTKRSTLNIVATNVEAITDCEDLDSSDERSIKEIPKAFVKQNLSLTDEENYEFETDSSNELPDIELPQPTRNMVILKETTSIPTVQILPLSDDYYENLNEGDALEVITDEESISESEEPSKTENNIIGIDLPLPDCGVIDVVENFHKSSEVPTIIEDNTEPLTETEEIFLDENKRRRRAPKLKHMHEKFLASQNKLTPKQQIENKLNDTEYLFLTDNETPLSLHPLLNLSDGATDVEFIGGSTDDEKYITNTIRPLSCTPLHLRNMEGDFILSKEGSGPISLQTHSIVKNNLKGIGIPITPVMTDTEDLYTSADDEIYNSYNRSENKEDNSNVMYLKGGGYPTETAEIKVISYDYYAFDRILTAYGDDPIHFGLIKDWDATKQSLDLGSSPQPLVKDAAPEGEDSTSTSAKESSPSNIKAEGEEHVEGDVIDQDRKVKDQQQLSDEMKELLKELGKESDQI